MSEEKSSYRQILKATSIFWGVQLFNIFISLIRSKFVSVLLGPVGIGINGLFNSTLGLVAGFTNFGLSISAVKNTAEAYSTGDTEKVSTVVTVLKKLVWLTGIFGAITTIVLSKWLSTVSFGNADYTYAFMYLSVTLLINQLTSGNLVVLQGLRKLKQIAQSSLIGSVIGLLISIPLFYFYKLDGIVPSIIFTSIISYVLSFYYYSKIKIEKAILNKEIVKEQGLEMLNKGFLLSVSSMINLGANYLILIYISYVSGVRDVGLYNAGFAIINTYVGMIFTAMSTDYYPRLSAVAHDNCQSSKLINQQGELTVLILAPILTVFIVFIEFIVILLYSTEFVEISKMIQIAALGMFFKGASWPIGFIMLSKGDSKVFFWSEFFAIGYTLLLNILFYNIFGITGLGASFLLSYVLVFIQVYLIAKYKYEYNIQKSFLYILGIQFFLGICAFLVVLFLNSLQSKIIGSGIIIASSAYSLFQFNKLLNIKELINGLLNKKG